MPFSQIRGQSHAVDYLKRSLVNRRIAHAYLFSGPEGVGKKTTAIALAQALNCQTPENNDACGDCLACRKIAVNTHPDVQHIGPDGQSIKIEQIREHLQREVILKPLEGKTKLYTLDPADAMTLESANSILKLLEEPPENVVIVLISSRPFSLLETIRSRCREIRFRALEKKVLTSWLVTRLEISSEEAATLAMLSGGRPAEALRLADPELQELRHKVLGMVREIQPGQWPVLANQLGDYRTELPEIFSFLLTWYRDLLVLLKKGGQGVIINRDQMEALEQAVRQETAEALVEKCSVLLHALEQLKRNVNSQLLLENLFIRLERPLQGI
ncbi:DNA polymerase III subunit delta' [bacterium]|nr:DNA polymerase III subunit delta' [bacterium]